MATYIGVFLELSAETTLGAIHYTKVQKTHQKKSENARPKAFNSGMLTHLYPSVRGEPDL